MKERVMCAVNAFVCVFGVVCFAFSIVGFVIYSDLNYTACCIPKDACHNLDSLKNSLKLNFDGTEWYDRAIVERDPTTKMCVLFGASPLLSDSNNGDYGCSSDLALDASQYHQRPQPSEDQFINTSSWPWNKTCVPNGGDECSKKSTNVNNIVSSVFLLFIAISCGVVVFGSIARLDVFTIGGCISLIICGVITLATGAVVIGRGPLHFITADIEGPETEELDRLVDFPQCPLRYEESELMAIQYMLPFKKGASGPDRDKPNVYTYDKIIWLLAMHITFGCVSVVFAPAYCFMDRNFGR